MSENRLKDETSPYLLQHKDNPVHWWPWGPEALAEAERTGKPILLSVGYAACHWCHVMAHESFEDADTAAVMNDHFVNIKVDREERPDIDAIYMGALHRLGEQGGWPMTMFLDSKGRPFWGGTYFPKQPKYGRPAFATVLLRLAEAYQNQSEDVANNAEKLIASLQAESDLPAGRWVSEDQIAELVSRIEGAVDAVHGGLTGAPKFPQWSVFWLLWRGGIRFDNAAARDAVITTLTHICQGGIYDHLGGGFARYSVDEKWLVPHFEKMLYDNALLIDLMTEAWRETHSELFAERIAETVDWLEREMIAEGGGFAASLDADSEGVEGKFYVWTEAEIMDVLGDDDGSFFCGMYGVTPNGNFEGQTILNRLDHLTRAKPEDEQRLKTLRDKLLSVRDKRVRPGWDDKVLADWNGLMIAALARAATVFKKPEWLKLAQRAFDFVSAQMALEPDRLWHSSRDGKTRAPAVASDYANMTWAAIRLLEATGEEKYLDRAFAWTKTMDAHYWDDNAGGYYASADDTEDVVVRLKPAIDDAQPSANAIQLWNLIALEALTGDIQHGSRAEAVLGAYSTPVAQSPFAHCGLIAASLDRNSLMQISVPSGTDSTLVDATNMLSLPGAVTLKGDGRIRFHAVVNDENGGISQAYICQGQTCLAPIASADELKSQLEVCRRATISKH